jgi:hypothetical protein
MGLPARYGRRVSIPLDLWGQRGWAGAEVAGESHFADAIRTLLGKDFKATGTEIVVMAQLIPEPRNDHDRNAVGVWSGGLQLGYLPREEAARYAPALSALTAQGWLPQVSARVWGSEWSEYDDQRVSFRGSIRLDLAEPHMLVPANLPPDGEHRTLPVGNAIQVTGEEKHLDALAPLHRCAGEPALVVGPGGGESYRRGGARLQGAACAGADLGGSASRDRT